MSVHCAEMLPFDCDSTNPEVLLETGALMGDVGLLAEVEYVELPPDAEPGDVDEIVEELELDPNTVVLAWRAVTISPAGKLLPLAS